MSVFWRGMHAANILANTLAILVGTGGGMSAFFIAASTIILALAVKDVASE